MTEATIHSQPRRTLLLIWMILAQILMLGSLVIWLVVAGFSVMAFDAGVTAQAWTLVILVWAYPILPVGLIIAAWRAYAKHRGVLAVVLSSLSFAPPILLFLAMFISNYLWFAQNGGLMQFK
ncbi:MAG: hypothetical protein HUU23_09275 [Caldilineales bacterium]|nr:hypothetical protein [Caldilineales bacterium]